MTKKQGKRLAFFFAILVFITSAPLIVLYALGYRWDATSQALERTGGIFVVAKPKNATVTVLRNGKVVAADQTRTLIDGLFPAAYSVTVAAPNYTVWYGNLIVRATEVNRLNDIVLLRQKPLVTPIAPLAPVDTISISPGNTWSLAQTKDTAYFTDFSSGTTTALDNTQLQTISNVQWLQGDTPSFLALNKKALLRYTIVPATGQVEQTLLVPNAIAFSVYHDRIFFIDASTKSLVSLSLDGRNRRPIAPLPNLTFTAGRSKIWVVNQKRLFLLTDNTLFKIEPKNANSAIQLKTDVTDAQLSPDNSMFLLSSGRAVSILKLNAPTNKITPIAQSGSNDLHWSDNNAHVAWLSGVKLKFADIADTNTPFITELTLPTKPLAFGASGNSVFGVTQTSVQSFSLSTLVRFQF